MYITITAILWGSRKLLAFSDKEYYLKKIKLKQTIKREKSVIKNKNKIQH